MGDVGRTIGQVGGALTGGSIGGPIGAVLGYEGGGALGGGGLGGLGDWMGLNPTNVDTGAFAPSASEAAFTQALQARYNGTGAPSPAQLQMQAGLDKANQQAMGMAAAQRGVSPGLAANLAAKAQGANAMQVNQDAGILRAQEQQSTGNLLASMYASQRGSAQDAARMQTAANDAAQGRRMGILNNLAGAGAKAAMMSQGGKVGGQPQVSGDSPANDTVKALLSPGEIVVPRSKAQNADDAKDFIDTLMKSKKEKADRPKSFGELLKKQKMLEERLSKLEGKKS